MQLYLASLIVYVEFSPNEIKQDLFKTAAAVQLLVSQFQVQKTAKKISMGPTKCINNKF
jgi:hypothetical protein